MYIYFSAVMGASGSFTHVDNIEAAGNGGYGTTTSELVRYGAALYSGDTQLYLYGNLAGYAASGNNTIDAAIGPASDASSLIPLGQWLCYEWHMGGPSQVGDFWFNGTHVDGLTPPGYGWSSSWLYPTYSSISLGWQAWGTLPQPITVWIDDVAVGTSRMGCL
jgi:hypothetical protein